MQWPVIDAAVLLQTPCGFRPGGCAPCPPARPKQPAEPAEARRQHDAVQPGAKRGQQPGKRQRLRDRRPDLLAEGETPRGGRFSARSFLTPAEAVISSIVADVVEYDFIVDLHLKRRGSELQQERQTMIVWVRQIDLEREVATKAVGDRVLEELRSVFRR